MSVRAYKIKKIEYEDSPTFNLSHNENVIRGLNLYDQLNDNGGGVICIEKEEAESALKKIKGKANKDIIKAILKDIGDDDYVEYSCF